MIIFDGLAYAGQKELLLHKRVAALHARSVFPKVGAVFFTEDKGSQIYTRIKREVAERVGIGYSGFEFSMKDDFSVFVQKIHEMNTESSITGIIIQKPVRSLWEQATGRSDFREWWKSIVQLIDPKKDVDGLHPETLQAIEKGTWTLEKKVMPATAKAVLEIIDSLGPDAIKNKKSVVIGRTEILGLPLFYELKNRGYDVELLGTAELHERAERKTFLLDKDIIISSTGRPGLIRGEMIKAGAVLIDVGEPKSDVDRASVGEKASFLTPVPGGVGPMTVVCLLENAVTMMEQGLE